MFNGSGTLWRPGKAIAAFNDKAEVKKSMEKRKSTMRIRMQKVFTALDELKKKQASGVQAEQEQQLIRIQTLIQEAHSAIDVAVEDRSLNDVTGRKKKLRLALALKSVQLALGLKPE